MKRILMGDGVNDLLGTWISNRTGGSYIPGSGKCIGLVEDDKVIAGVLYEQYNGASILMHVAAEEGKRWLNRDYLYACFAYPFLQLRVKVVLGLVPEVNLQARRFDEHLGFEIQATLKDAHPEGDLLIYGMTPDKCRWLKLRS